MNTWIIIGLNFVALHNKCFRVEVVRCLVQTTSVRNYYHVFITVLLLFLQIVVCSNCVYSDVSSARLYIGGLLLRHICQLVCNAHAITEIERTQTSQTSLVDTSSQVRMATAIYPTASLMNHSCDPTIISRYCSLLTRVIQLLQRGTKVSTLMWSNIISNPR